MEFEPPEIYSGINEDFDFDEEKKIAVWTAKWFIMQGFPKESTLKNFNLSIEDYEKWENVEQ